MLSIRKKRYNCCMPATVTVDINVLTNSEAFHTFSLIMVKLTGLAVALYTPDGNALRAYPITLHRNPLCTLIREHATGNARCFASEHARFAGVVASGQTFCGPCHAGFIDLAIPVKYQEQVVAIISSGQILAAPPCEEGLQALLPLCAAYHIPPEVLRVCYHQCTYLEPEKIDAAIHLLTFFAEYLCAMAQRLSEADQSTTLVSRAREYIALHLAEELSLSEVATYAQCSPGTLSRQFVRVTGSTFTNYLQKARIEQVRRQLLHSSLPITEIAFNNGFSSTSQFNRTFRKYLGCTPRSYRARTK